jgi:hypothetical protein
MECQRRRIRRRRRIKEKKGRRRRIQSEGGMKAREREERSQEIACPASARTRECTMLKRNHLPAVDHHCFHLTQNRQYRRVMQIQHLSLSLSLKPPTPSSLFHLSIRYVREFPLPANTHPLALFSPCLPASLFLFLPLPTVFPL